MTWQENPLQLKKDCDENEVDVGGSEMYEPRCLSQHDRIRQELKEC